MAFELPIISTNVFGIPEQIEDMKEGILIEPGNTNLLVEKINFLIKNPRKAQELANNGHKKLCRQLTLEHMTRSYENLIKELIRTDKQSNLLKQI